MYTHTYTELLSAHGARGRVAPGEARPPRELAEYRGCLYIYIYIHIHIHTYFNIETNDVETQMQRFVSALKYEYQYCFRE